MRAKRLVATGSVLAALAAPATARAAGDPVSQTSGGAAFVDQDAFRPTVPGPLARIADGLAAAPADAPPVVQRVIWAGNRIVGLPYRYGGGHGPGFEDTAYDCSGTVSYALSGSDLVASPLDSSAFLRWGVRGRGAWLTVFTSPGHAYLEVAGIRLDTSAADDRSGRKGPRWRPLRRSNRGYRARHPLGL